MNRTFGVGSPFSHRRDPRYHIAGHAATCRALPELSVRYVDGLYRLARSCACGAVLDLAPSTYPTHAAAWAVIRRLRPD